MLLHKCIHQVCQITLFTPIDRITHVWIYLLIKLGVPIIVFRPDIDLSHENDETYTGKLDKIDELKIWAQDKCVPLVRYISHYFTFRNRKV